MTMRSDIKSLADHMIPGSFEMLVREWANCWEAQIDADGDIWIAYRPAGHWLSETDLISFAAWTGTIDLDEAQARHNPAWGTAKGLT